MVVVITKKEEVKKKKKSFVLAITKLMMNYECIYHNRFLKL